MTNGERKTADFASSSNYGCLVCSQAGQAGKNWVGQKYPKIADGRLFLIQQAPHASARPLTCTWASLLDAEPGEAVPVEDVLNIIQRTIVLMDNVNALTTQAQQQTVLEVGCKEVAAMMKDEMPQVERHLSVTTLQQP